MWPVRPYDEPAVAALARAADTDLLTARLLWLRGVRDADGARRWLEPRLSDLYPPELLPDFEPAVARVFAAIERRETILIWGHDDLDGITAVALLKLVLEDLRARVRFHIPARGAEKHGLDAGREDVLAGAGLVITVDCGITSGPEVAKLARRGLDVVVTDHHELSDDLPPAVACVDPKRPDSKYPYRGLAGAGVAIKFALGLTGRRLGLSTAGFWSVRPEAVALAVLGTIADRVPLTGENRTLVACGIEQLNSCRFVSVRAVFARLTGEAGAARGRYAALAALPRLLPLFAAAEGMDTVGRLVGGDATEAGHWLDGLEVLAREWQAEAERAWALAQEVVRVGDGLVVVKDRRMSLRALGTSATRLRFAHRLPALVMGWRGDAWVGECRGTEGMSLMELLRAMRDYFLDYGGHRLAAGFTIRDERVEEFIVAAERYAHEHFAGSIAAEGQEFADAELPLAEFDPGLARLAPFGDGNPRPLFISEPTRVTETGGRWTADTRPDLPLYPARPALEPRAGTVRLLYTLDDDGRALVRDSRAEVDGA